MIILVLKLKFCILHVYPENALIQKNILLVTSKHLYNIDEKDNGRSHSFKRALDICRKLTAGIVVIKEHLRIRSLKHAEFKALFVYHLSLTCVNSNLQNIIHTFSLENFLVRNACFFFCRDFSMSLLLYTPIEF